MANRPAHKNVIKDTGIRVPVSDEIVLDWYAMTDPWLCDMNPSLRDYAEKLIEEVA